MNLIEWIDFVTSIRKKHLLDNLQVSYKISDLFNFFPHAMFIWDLLEKHGSLHMNFLCNLEIFILQKNEFDNLMHSCYSNFLSDNFLEDSTENFLWDSKIIHLLQEKVCFSNSKNRLCCCTLTYVNSLISMCRLTSTVQKN